MSSKGSPCSAWQGLGHVRSEPSPIGVILNVGRSRPQSCNLRQYEPPYFGRPQCRQSPFPRVSVVVIPARGRGRGGHGGLAARSRGRGRGHGRALGGGVDESDNESDDEAADESDAEATASEDPGLHVNEAGDAASDAENADDDLPLSTLQSALQGV